MIYTYKLFDEIQVKNILSTYRLSHFDSGTFGKDQKLDYDQKNNSELQKTDKNYQKLQNYVYDIVKSHPDFTRDLCVSKNGSLIFSQYKEGMFYDWHHDAAVMSGLRTDMSCTVFLSDPNEYEGGELSIMTGSIETKFKEPPGTAVVYPTGLLHKVNEVKSGVRNVVVFWIESYIKDPNYRDILIDLNIALEHFHKEDLHHTNREIFNKLLRAKLNIERYCS